MTRQTVMLVDVWSWKCGSCGWEVRSQFTVNPQRAVAEALIKLHLQEHIAVAHEGQEHTA